jgi:hypothetical protein
LLWEFLDTSCSSSSMICTNFCHTALTSLCHGFYKDQLVSECNFTIKKDKVGKIGRTHGKS